MADPRFFDNRGPFTLKELADRIGARLGPGCEAGLLLHDVAPIESAGPGMLTYLDRGKDPAALEGMMAAACLVPPNAAIADRTGTAWLIADLPRRAFALASQSFYPRQAASGRVTAGAVIDPSARIGIGVEIGANAVVEAGAEIGDRTLLGPGAVVGRNVTIGRDCVIGPVVSLSHCHVGDRVTLHAGVRIGQDGFGVVPGAKHTKVPQLGRAIIQDDVEIGANSCVDRGTAGDTVIGEGTCIDNLVQIGHNVRIGRYCVLAALIGISGSVTIGDYVAIGGQSGFKDHITVGDGAEIGAQSGVMRDVQPGERIVGSPAQPVKRFFRMIAILARMTDHAGKNG